MNKFLQKQINFYEFLDATDCPFCEPAKLENGELVIWRYNNKTMHGFVVEDEGKLFMIPALFTDEGFAVVPAFVSSIPDTVEYCLLAKFDYNAAIEDSSLVIIDDPEVKEWLAERTRDWVFSMVDNIKDSWSLSGIRLWIWHVENFFRGIYFGIIDLIENIKKRRKE